jgi:hypothetical protein
MADVKGLVEERHGAIDVLKTWLPRVALAIVFVSAGALKFAAHSVYVRIFDEIGLGQWFRYLTGVVERRGRCRLHPRRLHNGGRGGLLDPHPPRVRRDHSRRPAPRDHRLRLG